MNKVLNFYTIPVFFRSSSLLLNFAIHRLAMSFRLPADEHSLPLPRLILTYQVFRMFIFFWFNYLPILCENEKLHCQYKCIMLLLNILFISDFFSLHVQFGWMWCECMPLPWAFHKKCWKSLSKVVSWYMHFWQRKQRGKRWKKNSFFRRDFMCFLFLYIEFAQITLSCFISVCVCVYVCVIIFQKR